MWENALIAVLAELVIKVLIALIHSHANQYEKSEILSKRRIEHGSLIEDGDEKPGLGWGGNRKGYIR